jgi:Ca2+-binding RTX toxin-like protein
MSRLVGSLVLAAVVSAVGATSASAAVSCTYDGGAKSVSVALSAAGDDPAIVREADNIAVIAGVSIVSCGTQPTVTNTDTITVTDGSAGSNRVDIDLSDGPFAPGFTNELGGSDEIEIQVDLGAGNSDELRLLGTSGDDSLRLGSGGLAGGVNLNAGLESGPGAANDADLGYVGLDGDELLSVEAGAGHDRVIANGGAEFVGPPLTNLMLVGGDGDDVLAGGSGFDRIVDGRGNDHLSGGERGDEFFQDISSGDDTFVGNDGTDQVSYSDIAGPTRVDLRLTGRQDTGAGGRDALSGIENAFMGPRDDVLIGDGASNELNGAAGDDLVMGGGGVLDELLGGNGTDTLSYASAPARVSVDLAIVAPAILATGGAGSDRITGFENLVGSPFGDLLAGTDGANAITGLGGADLLVARGGNDALAIRDGADDDTRCGAGSDVVTADVAGVDLLAADCESTAFDVRPDTGIVAGPTGLTRDATPSFGFRTTKAGSTFECSLDDRSYAACSSGRALARVRDGAHTLRVRSRDPLGALDLTPAVRVFSTDATRPRITRVRLAGSSLRYRLSEDARVRIKVQRCAGTRCRTVKSLRRRGRKGANRVRIRGHDRAVLSATDRAGNRSATKRLRTPA